MPNLTIQRFIYRNFVQRPTVNRTLDRFGCALNKIGLPYATGLTRNKAILFTSSNLAEIGNAEKDVLASNRDRARLAVAENHLYRLSFPPGTRITAGLIEIINDEFPKAFKKHIRAAIAAKLSPEQILDLFGKSLRTFGKDTKYLSTAFDKAKKIFTPNQIHDLFDKIVEKCGKDAFLAFGAFSALFTYLTFRDSSARDAALTMSISMLESLTDYNRQQILSLLKDSQTVYENIGSANFLPHYNLYMNILTNYKRLGFPLLEGILEATKQGIIPRKLLPEEIRKIKFFINAAHNFSPIVYKVYRAEGDALLRELMPLAKRIAEDGLGKEEIEAIVKKYEKYDGLEFLYAIIQMSIPLSGASFVKREEGKGLLQAMMRAGDLRNHVPKSLRGITRSVSLTGSEHVLKENEAIDLRVINPILEGLRSERKAEQAELVSAIEEYLRSDRNEIEKEKVRQALYSYASKRDLLGEKVDRLGSADYYTLRLLEEIFRDKDCLASIMVRAIDKLPPALLAADKSRITHPDTLVKAINKMWQGKTKDDRRDTMDEKIRRLASMTAKYREEDLRAIAASGKLKPEIVSALNELLRQENKVYISKHKLAEELLREPLAVIQKEKAKYELKSSAEGINLSLQMVKGIPYGLWGLNAGVCIVSDIELWKDPNFKLIAMIDKETKTAVGFIHIYEVEIKGKKYWTLPGIEPSTEFIGTVNPEELYDKLVEQTIALAKEAGMAGVYIPTNSTIHSNRSDIQKAIKDKNYSTRMIPKVNWSRQPAYPFTEVFVVWDGE